VDLALLQQFHVEVRDRSHPAGGDLEIHGPEARRAARAADQFEIGIAVAEVPELIGVR
jgi:hypothetical protein